MPPTHKAYLDEFPCNSCGRLEPACEMILLFLPTTLKKLQTVKARKLTPLRRQIRLCQRDECSGHIIRVIDLTDIDHSLR